MAGAVFCPYMYLGGGDSFKLTDCDDACALKHYTLAFIIARQEGRGKEAKYLKEPAWDGRTSMIRIFIAAKSRPSANGAAT